MIDYDKQIVTALKSILPTYHELLLVSGTKTPCISYQEINNAADLEGDTIGYSIISYQVKVWGTDIAQIKNYVLQIDRILRPLGFKRISTNELADRNSAMIQKILLYEATALETF